MKHGASESSQQIERLSNISGNAADNVPASATAQPFPAGRESAHDEIAEAARFPMENPNPVFRVAPDGRLLYANQASRQLLVAWRVADDGCVPPAWRERFASVLAAPNTRKWDEECEGRVFQLTCVPIKGAGYVNVYGADITERVALAAQLTEQARLAKQRAAELEATLDAINDGLLILAPDGKIVRQNASAAPLLGFQASDLDLAMEERETQLTVELVSHPTAGPEQLPGQRALRGETVRGELMRVRPAGQAEDETRYVLVSAAPVRDPSGVSLGAVTTCTDVTELHWTRDRLAKRVEELKALLELLPVGIAISYDPECKDIRVNPAQAKALGMASDANVSLGADESRDRPPYRVFDQAGRELAVEELPMQAAAGGVEVRDMVIDILRADGTRLTMLSYATPLLDEAGKPRGAIAGFVDISAMRAAEVERERLLRELETRRLELEAQAEEIRALNASLEHRVQERTAELEAIFASVPDALYVMDQTGIVRANRAALESFGVRTIEELRQRAGTVAAPVGARHADTGVPLARDDTLFARAFRGERVVREIVSSRLDGGGEVIHRSAGAPITLNGKIIGVVGLAADITEQKRREQQLAYQATLLDNVNDAIFACDADMRITAWNKRAEEQYGWKAEEAIGAYPPDVVGSRLTPEHRAAVLREIAGSGRWRGEIEHTRRDGAPIIVEATAMRLCDEAGNIIGFVTVNRDITMRKRAEDELRTSREQLRTLSRRLVAAQEAERSYVADQLYNQAGQVLAALQMQLSMFGRENWRESPTDLLPTMQATVNEAIRELHDLALQLRPVGLDRSTLAGVLTTYVTEFGTIHGLVVQVCPGGTETLRVPADVATAVYRAVQEGLTNVARHAQASEIVVSLSRDRDRLTVALADNGVGFDSACGAGANVSMTGGLGLASIRERLETVGGQLRVESGKTGTTLYMQVPMSQEEQRK